MKALEAENIRIAYHRKEVERVLLKEFRIGMAPGSTLAIMGRNGAGKSSLLRVLSGIQSPGEGVVRWKGKALEEISRRERPRIAAALFSDFSRVPGLTVEELVALGRQPYAGLFGRLSKADRDAVTHAMEVTGIRRFAKEQVVYLSDGEFKKSLLAKLLAQDTPILMLDEPAAHLDVPATLELMILLRSLAKDHGKTVLLTSHDLTLAFRFVDRVLLLDGNGGYALGTPDEVTKHSMMSDFLASDKVKFEDGQLLVNLKGWGEDRKEK